MKAFTLMMVLVPALALSQPFIHVNCYEKTDDRPRANVSIDKDDVSDEREAVIIPRTYRRGETAPYVSGITAMDSNGGTYFIGQGFQLFANGESSELKFDGIENGKAVPVSCERY